MMLSAFTTAGSKAAASTSAQVASLGAGPTPEYSATLPVVFCFVFFVWGLGLVVGLVVDHGMVWCMYVYTDTRGERRDERRDESHETTCARTVAALRAVVDGEGAHAEAHHTVLVLVRCVKLMG